MAKKYFIYLFISLLFIPTSMNAQWYKFWKKRHKTEVANKKTSKSKYEKLLEDHKIDSAKSKFLSLYKTEGKLYIEMPISLLGKDLLLASTLTSITNPNIGTIGFKNNDPIAIRFVKKDEKIILEQLNSAIYDKDLKKLIFTEKHYNNASNHSFSISTYNTDSTAIVFDASSFFLSENKIFPSLASANSSFVIRSNPKENLTRITKIKSFEDNASICVEKSFNVSISNRGGKLIKDNYPLTLSKTYTLLYLPQEPMSPRISDNRIGIFQSNARWLNPDNNNIENIAFAKRWRLEPKDSIAFTKGELSEVKKPIVFYLDTLFPETWKQPLRDGICRWNKAFEKIGFKNVISVKDFPKNDADFDPDNLKYNCIRYIPSKEENAMGPSWVDPRTGEIINASVSVYANVVNIIRDWRFIQTAQLDEQMRQKDIPYEQFANSLSYVIAHEIGHTLGFMHNMAASSAFPTDSLRSVSFTKKNGTTPSIMDYARNNYVAQVEDKGVSLTPPFLGQYDYLLIEWNYKYFPKLHNNSIAEAKELFNLLESYAGNKDYRYGTQQFGDLRYDPSAVEEDLGDDPQKSSELGLRNLRFILKHLGEWISDDTERQEALYTQIAYQAYMFMDHVAMNIGGVYLYPTSESSQLDRYKVVSKERQKSSTLWLVEQAKNFHKLENEALVSNFKTQERLISTLAKNVQIMAVTRLSKVSMTHYLDSSTYSPLEYLEDVYNSVFNKTLANKENLTEAEKSLQTYFVKFLKSGVKAVASESGDIFLQMPNTQKPKLDFCYIQDSYDKEHLKKELNALGFGEGYGSANEMWLQSVNKSLDYAFLYARKTKDLLEKAIKKSHDEEIKLHYQVLLNELTR